MSKIMFENMLDAIEKVRKESIHSHEEASIFYRELAVLCRGYKTAHLEGGPAEVARQISAELFQPIMARGEYDSLFEELEEHFEYFETCAAARVTLTAAKEAAAVAADRVEQALNALPVDAPVDNRNRAVVAALEDYFMDFYDLDFEEIDFEIYDHEYPEE